jgi:hypothetical protein
LRIEDWREGWVVKVRDFWIVPRKIKRNNSFNGREPGEAGSGMVIIARMFWFGKRILENLRNGNFVKKYNANPLINSKRITGLFGLSCSYKVALSLELVCDSQRTYRKEGYLDRNGREELKALDIPLVNRKILSHQYTFSNHRNRLPLYKRGCS